MAQMRLFEDLWPALRESMSAANFFCNPNVGCSEFGIIPV